MFVFACGCGSDDPLERPSGSPPEETPEEVPTPPERIEYGDDGNGNPTYLLTRNLYNATHIEVFYTIPTKIREGRGFVYILEACALYGVVAGHSFDKVGVLNGMFKEQGYTKDFLLNPDVERTFVDSDGDVVDYRTINYEFDHPLAISESCTDGNEVTCKRFMCGVETGD